MIKGSISGSFVSVIMFAVMFFVVSDSYRKMRGREMSKIKKITKLPTVVYRKWYAAIVPVCGLFGAVLYNIISLSDPQRGNFDGVVLTEFQTVCIFSAIGFYMLCVLASGVLFVIRLIVYGNEKSNVAFFILVIPVGIALFPIYYIYNGVCLIIKKRTVMK